MVVIVKRLKNTDKIFVFMNNILTFKGYYVIIYIYYVYAGVTQWQLVIIGYGKC